MPPDHDADVQGPRLIKMWIQQKEEKNQPWYEFQRESDNTGWELD